MVEDVLIRSVGLNAVASQAMWARGVRGMSMSACPTPVDPRARQTASSWWTTTAATVSRASWGGTVRARETSVPRRPARMEASATIMTWTTLVIVLTGSPESPVNFQMTSVPPTLAAQERSADPTSAVPSVSRGRRWSPRAPPTPAPTPAIVLIEYLSLSATVHSTGMGGRVKCTTPPSGAALEEKSLWLT